MFSGFRLVKVVPEVARRGLKHRRIFIQRLYVDVTLQKVREEKKGEGFSITGGINESDPVEHDHTLGYNGLHYKALSSRILLSPYLDSENGE